MKRSLGVAAFAAMLAVSSCGSRGPNRPLARAEAVGGSTSTSIDFASLAPPSTEAPATTTAPTPATAKPGIVVAAPPSTRGVKAPPPPPKARRPLVFDATSYRGLGTWVDVYDWSRSYTNNKPDVGPGDVDRMAAAGIQTLYIQASKWDASGDIVDPDLLNAIIARAHAHGIRVVGWYLPTLTDPNADMRRLLAVAALPIEGLAVDIEARDVQDVNERNRRLVDLSARLRQALPGRPIGGIVLPPVVMEVINPNYWPNFPWRGIEPYYDVWLPMSYWTNRTQDSGYRDGYRYTADNIVRLRNDLGDQAAPVQTIGGLAASVTPGDVDGMVRAAAQYGCLGGGLYDWHTTAESLWGRLAPLRS